MMQIPIFILHGWAIDAQNHSKWSDVIELLKQAGYEAHFLSLPGFVDVIEKPWNLTDYVEWVHKKLESYPEVILIGHSFGGQLAVRYAKTYPNQVQTLILIDSAGIRPFTLKARVKRALFQGIAKVGKMIIPFDQARIVLHRLAREKDYLEASPMMRETMKFVLADEVLDDLPSISAKTLIIWGEQDKATPVTHARLFEAGIRKSQLELIPGARHSPQFTQPGIVVEKIVTFLNKVVKKK